MSLYYMKLPVTDGRARSPGGKEERAGSQAYSTKFLPGRARALTSVYTPLHSAAKKPVRDKEAFPQTHTVKCGVFSLPRF